MSKANVNSLKNNGIMTLYPISDKISKEQIRNFLRDQKYVEQDDDI